MFGWSQQIVQMLHLTSNVQHKIINITEILLGWKFTGVIFLKFKEFSKITAKRFMYLFSKFQNGDLYLKKSRSKIMFWSKLFSQKYHPRILLRNICIHKTIFTCQDHPSSHSVIKETPSHSSPILPFTSFLLTSPSNIFLAIFIPFKSFLHTSTCNISLV